MKITRSIRKVITEGSRNHPDLLPHSPNYTWQKCMALSLSNQWEWLDYYCSSNSVKRRCCHGLCKTRACFDCKSWHSAQYKHKFLSFPLPLRNCSMFLCGALPLGPRLSLQWELCWIKCAGQHRAGNRSGGSEYDSLSRCKAFRLTMGSRTGRSQVRCGSDKFASLTAWSGDCYLHNPLSYKE